MNPHASLPPRSCLTFAILLSVGVRGLAASPLGEQKRPPLVYPRGLSNLVTWGRLAPAGRSGDLALARRGSGHRRMRSDDSSRGREVPARVAELLDEIKSGAHVELEVRAGCPGTT